jgi:hypothetical protein
VSQCNQRAGAPNNWGVLNTDTRSADSQEKPLDFRRQPTGR